MAHWTDFERSSIDESSAMKNYLWTQLNYDRISQQLFCDFTLIVDEEEFKAHKCVLGVVSGFFKSVFTSKLPAKDVRQDTIIVVGIKSEMLELILDYVYGGDVEISPENVYDLTAAADYLQIPPIKDDCADFLHKNVTCDTCIKDWITARKYDLYCEGLDRFIYYNSSKLNLNSIFELSFGDFKAFLKIKENMTSLNYSEWVVSWFKYDRINRQKHFEKLFSQIDLEKLPTRYLKETVANFTKYHAKVANILKVRKNASKSVDGFFALSALSLNETIIHEFSAVDREWSQYSKLPTFVTDFEVVWKKEKVFVLGGLTSLPTTTSSKCVWSLNRMEASTSIPVWKAEGLLNDARHNFGCTIFNDCIYVAGGRSGKSSQKLSSVESYDLIKESWMREPSMEIERSNLALVSQDNCLYAIGGGAPALTAVECYDGRVWKTRKSMNTRRAKLAAVALNGYIYAIGGTSSLRNCLLGLNEITVERYDPSADEWCFVASMNKVKVGHRACVWNGKIYVADKDSSEVYDPVANEWEKFEGWDSKLP